MMFNLLKARVEEKAREKKETTKFFIENGFCQSWSVENRNNPDEGLRRYSTASKWEKYKAGEITREKAVEIATKRAFKEIEKRTAEKIEKLERIEKADSFEVGSIYIDWVRSSTWGYNPHCEFYTGTTKYFGSASGCGYDKESAAVAQALNACPEILKALYTLKENALQAGENDGSATACTGIDNRNIIGYGAGYSVIPYFEGGVGVSCFWRILEKAGIEVTTHYHKHGNTYILSKV